MTCSEMKRFPALKGNRKGSGIKIILSDANMLRAEEGEEVGQTSSVGRVTVRVSIVSLNALRKLRRG